MRIIRTSPEFQKLVKKIPIQAEDLVPVQDRKILIVPSAASPDLVAEVVDCCERLVHERLELEKSITSGQRLSRHSRALITWVERGEFLGPAENQFGVFVVLDSKRLQESSTTIERQYGNSEEFEKVTPVGFKPPQQLLLETSSQPRDIVVGRKTEDGVSVKAEIFEVGDILILTKPEFLKVKNGTIPLIAILYMKQIGEVEAGEPSSVG